MMLLCLAVAAEEKLDNQATETQAVRVEAEDRTLSTQIPGNKEESPASLCLFKYVITTIRMKSIS